MRFDRNSTNWIARTLYTDLWSLPIKTYGVQCSDGVARTATYRYSKYGRCTVTVSVRGKTVTGFVEPWHDRTIWNGPDELRFYTHTWRKNAHMLPVYFADRTPA